MNIYTTVSHHLMEKLIDVPKNLRNFPNRLKNNCEIARILFINTFFPEIAKKEHEKVQLAKKEENKVRKVEEIARIEEDLKRIEKKWPERECKIRELDRGTNFVVDQIAWDMRKEDFIKRNLTKYQRNHLYPEPEAERSARKRYRERIKVREQSYEYISSRFDPKEAVNCLYQSINFKKVFKVACVGLAGYLIYAVV